MPAVRLRILRSLEEPLGGVVCDVDLREPDEESRLLQASACLHVMVQYVGQRQLRDSAVGRGYYGEPDGHPALWKPSFTTSRSRAASRCVTD
jgi:hypothetical protein